MIKRIGLLAILLGTLVIGCAPPPPPTKDLNKMMLVASIGHDGIVERIGRVPPTAPAVAKLTELMHRQHRPWDKARDSGFPTARVIAIGEGLTFDLQPRAMVILRWWYENQRVQRHQNTVVALSSAESQEVRKLLIDSIYDPVADSWQKQADQVLRAGMSLDEADMALARLGIKSADRHLVSAEEDVDYDVGPGYALTVHWIAGEGIVGWVAHRTDALTAGMQ